MNDSVDNAAFDFGKRLQELRLSRNLSQEDVATRLGLHTKTISAYETNLRAPKYAILKKLATLYNTSTDYMLNHADRANLYLDELPLRKQQLVLEIFNAVRQEYEDEA